ncbi:hypothetical protein HZH68_006135 [Vespula germanica]|uniref:Uncharacterized protein n=1 Tax=Vespula germanica TaxID=30212 RepID=A0A834KAW6_VESGE|nr:hypothetical protein HZH68_006135 [Vespula germanica]
MDTVSSGGTSRLSMQVMSVYRKRDKTTRHTLVFTAMKYPQFSEARSRRPFTFSDRNALSCTLAKLQVRRRPKPEKSSSDRNPEGVSPLRLHHDDCYFAFARL